MKNSTKIGLGANISGNLGSPADSLRQSVAFLAAHGCPATKTSSLYITRPLSALPQPHYFNAVIVVDCPLAPAALLRLLKSIEHKAGRRQGPRNGPRPLDLDILDYKGRVIGWPLANRRGTIVLPHPEMHRRLFVLEPLAEVAPEWRHPVLHVSARQLARKLPNRAGEIERFLDPGWISCDKGPSLGQSG